MCHILEKTVATDIPGLHHREHYGKRFATGTPLCS
jgi:hypothetical protein